MTEQYTHDVLVIGSGAAGLSLALQIADQASVAVLAKGPMQEGSTFYAQGGISAVLDSSDSTDAHLQDTMVAGAGLCDQAVVQYVVEHARESIEWLIDLGVLFTRATSENGGQPFHLTREGGHSHRRIIHADDATGKAVETTLDARAREHRNIDLYEDHIAIDLITARKLGYSYDRCLGAYVLDKRQNQVTTFRARFVVLATGGAGKVYLYTSNPDIASADGIAMAWRAGCPVANMEFIQFHPTCLYDPNAKSFLLSESIRGEGGILRLPDGEAFMQRYDPRADLAPRDIVARAIDREMKRLGSDCVYLDITHKGEKFIREHFPNIYARCLEYGYDMAREPLPVVPAAHYLCGGVKTGLNGQTAIPGFYAIGEVAYTGLHGANRLASNSMLECFVFARACCQSILAQLSDVQTPADIPDWDESQVTDSDEEVVVAHNWDELRRFMWDYVGIVRSNKRLQRAQHRIDLLKREIDEYYGNFRVTSDLIELRNLVMVAELIVRSALSRKESRGLHFTLDYPETDNSTPPRPTLLAP